MNPLARSLIDAITAQDAGTRDRPLRGLIEGAPTADLLDACEQLERFRRGSENLYERVRASMFLHAIHRYALADAPDIPATGLIPFEGVEDLLHRRFEQAIAAFRARLKADGPRGAILSALAQAYEQITYQTLADQVRRSVRSCRGNRWMFRVGHPDELPLRLHPRLLERSGDSGPFPVLVERTPVRLDLSHSAWSDILFLGMDYPEGAASNISVDLAVHGRDAEPRRDRGAIAASSPSPAAADQHRPGGDPGRRYAGRTVQLRQRLPGPGEGRRDRLGPDPAVDFDGNGTSLPEIWRGSSGRGTAWRSSARSTTSPRARGWLSQQACSRP
ncbi:MAG: hypothetical protein U0800_00685 [Isosphaeraceae bacterium]